MERDRERQRTHHEVERVAEDLDEGAGLGRAVCDGAVASTRARQPEEGDREDEDRRANEGGDGRWCHEKAIRICFRVNYHRTGRRVRALARPIRALELP